MELQTLSSSCARSHFIQRPPCTHISLIFCYSVHGQLNPMSAPYTQRQWRRHRKWDVFPLCSVIISLPQSYHSPIIQIGKLSLAGVQNISHHHTVLRSQRRTLRFGFWLPEEKKRINTAYCPATPRQDVSVLGQPGSWCYFSFPLWMLRNISLVQENSGKGFRGSPCKVKTSRVLCTYRL